MPGTEAAATETTATPAVPETTPTNDAPASIPGERDFSEILTDPNGIISELEYFEDGNNNDEDDQPQPAKKATPAAADLFKGVKAEVADLMRSVAINDELDLSNPKDFKLARRIAESQQEISKLKRTADPESPDAKSYLDLFNDKEPAPLPVAKPAGEKPAAQTAEEPVSDVIPDYVALAKTWNTTADFADTLQGAFEMDDSPERKTAIANAFLGFIDRTMSEIYAPRIRQLIEHVQQERLGPVMHEVEQARGEAMRREVVETMAKQPEFSELMTLFDAASDGVIEVQGDQVADTWLNRMLVKYPDILDISIKGKTQRETDRKTTAAQYRMAFQMMKAERNKTPDKATTQSLIQTGRRIEQTKRDQTRTSLNAPGAPVPPGGRGKSVFATSSDDGEMSMADLFK